LADGPADGFLRLFDSSPSETEAEARVREVAAWTMPLQADMASLGTDFGRAVYFVMRSDDLKRREIRRAHAIWQQI
jgi:hypothetical protein